MPFEALSAKARLMVPVGAIDSRCELRRPCLRICSLISCRQARGEVAAGEVEVGVEQREGAAFLGQFDRGQVGAVAHVFGNLGRHGARLGGVVAQAQHDQRVAQAGEAEADAALGLRFGVLLRQRPVGGVEHVVEHAHRDVDDPAEGWRNRTRRSCR